MQIRLFVLTGNAVGEELLLEHEAVLGRLPSCDLVLPDTGVSRKHARVFLEDGALYVEDCGSANGTKIQGMLVKRARLEDGSVFVCGPVEVRVRVDAGLGRSAAETSIAGGTAAGGPSAEASRPGASPAAAGSAQVRPRSSAADVQLRPREGAPKAPSASQKPEGASAAGRGPAGILQYSRQPGRGVHAEDLSQRGLAGRLLAFGVVLVAAALLFYLAYHVAS